MRNQHATQDRTGPVPEHLLPPVLQLVGAMEYNTEPTRCRVVFHLETPDGARGTLTHGEIMVMLRFAEASGAIPPLGPDWWARDGGRTRCAGPPAHDDTGVPGTIHIDPATIITFEETRSGREFGIALGTILQCVCVSEALHVVPPLDEAWRKVAVHEAIQDSVTRIMLQAGRVKPGGCG